MAARLEWKRRLQELELKNSQKKYPNFPDSARPITNYSDKKSNALTKAIVDWIEFNGYQAERINSVGRRQDNTKIVTDVLGRQRQIGSVKWIRSSGRIGTADISATIRGRSVKIEVKCKATGDNKQSPGQISYQKEIEAAGGVYVIARDMQSFTEWYDNFIQNIQ